MSVTSTSENATDTIVDLLSGYTGWSITAPEVYAKRELSQSQRENNPDPALYVWSPVDTDFSEMDAEGSRLRQNSTVEIEVWTLNESNTEIYSRECVDYLSNYMRDRYQQTNWHQIVPINAADNRSEHIRQMTDHYIYTVQIELRETQETNA